MTPEGAANRVHAALIRRRAGKARVPRNARRRDMNEPGVQIDMAVLEERVRAAAWMVPEKEVRWRRLETRTRDRYDPRSSWMVRLHPGTDDKYAVELVPCDADDPGAMSLQKHQLPEQLRLDAQVLYDLWEEEQRPAMEDTLAGAAELGREPARSVPPGSVSPEVRARPAARARRAVRRGRTGKAEATRPRRGKVKPKRGRRPVRAAATKSRKPAGRRATTRSRRAGRAGSRKKSTGRRAATRSA